MKSVSGKELARLLERHGWTLLRIQGSHHIYGKTGHIILDVGCGPEVQTIELAKISNGKIIALDNHQASLDK